MDRIWTLERGEGPLVAVALHDGHDVRPEVAEALALDEAERLREEDPYTGRWTTIAPTRLVVHRSRFEVDLNRPRHEAVYSGEAWGRPVWKGGDGPPSTVAARSLAQYDAFYRDVEALFREIVDRHGHVVVLDLHSYNHRREGPHAAEADPQGNPDVNLGTGSLDRARWGPVADAFLETLEGRTLLGRRLDVRENVRFQGGWFSRWVHRTFPGTGCDLAIEVKKFWMDEWTGEKNERMIRELRGALASTVPGVLEELRRL